MRVKLMTIRCSSTLGRFDEQPLTDFMRDKEALTFREHFFSVNEVPHVACVITYQEPPLVAPAAAPAATFAFPLEPPNVP